MTFDTSGFYKDRIKHIKEKLENDPDNEELKHKIAFSEQCLRQFNHSENIRKKNEEIKKRRR
jgi:hypothetical protein